ncbi:type VI secretion system contractile sheath large subunit [Endozoicomonas euniceicola]|uniref:Type VI secretion system contractile sheath large subunit n=1 Tax=Endozoicomonas euniceicola TaxID=1234143 RepID=A0ABY6GS13_9GAMM|nr:type VI secretion system contractile sheath large subunit [Endozoicomonas euniceicola]UYM14851.1 type VI secretion system contractile sheath large subunit [Endozoicomonas euniceicola]
MSHISPEQKHQWRTEALIQKLVAGIDEMVALQLCVIIQHPAYKRVEALWRGLRFMLDAVPAYQVGKLLRVRILDLSWEELASDLDQSVSIHTSVLHRLICQQELNTLGGEPFGLLLVDHPVSSEMDEISGSDDFYLLQLLGELGHQSLCPVILPVARNFLGTDDINVWSDPVRVKRILASNDFVGWRRLRSQSVSQFLGLTLPEQLLRTPWQACYQRIHFNEYSVSDKDGDHLWGSSAFAFAGNVMKEFNRIRWFGFLRESEFGGALISSRTGLPLAARIRLTDSLEEFYSEQGFIPLTTCYLTKELAFFNNRSVFQPPVDDDDWRILSMIQTTLIGCRFGHYLKVMIRERIGGYRSSEACERDLNDWLQGYVSNVDYAEASILARYPLRRASAKISGDASLGVYHCLVELQPQYQFDAINTHIVLKADASELAATHSSATHATTVNASATATGPKGRSS